MPMNPKTMAMAVANNIIIMPHSSNVGANSLASLQAYSTVTNAVRPHEFSEEFTRPVEQILELGVNFWCALDRVQD